MLFREGDPADAIFIVVRGRLGVFRLDELEGVEQQVGVVGR